MVSSILLTFQPSMVCGQTGVVLITALTAKPENFGLTPDSEIAAIHHLKTTETIAV